jgi:alkaline phosphatase D
MGILRRATAARPQLFVFLGDNIYGDTQDMRVMKAQYDKLGSHPEYQGLKQQARILATWDDHDYGANDAGREYPEKAASKGVMMDFFEVPVTAAVRARPGVYQSYYFGEAGRRVQVLLLDTRWFRTKLKRNSKLRGYVPNLDPVGTILGYEQWQWLEGELQKPADLRIIGSSIQVLPAEHVWEAWNKIPHERTRLLKTLEARNGGAALIISGDRHMAEISKLDDLVDATSSGLNRAGGGSKKEPNKLRVGSVYSKTNFGLIEIDWETRQAVVSIRGKDGKVALEQAVVIPE